ncbi:MAG TPA: DUF4386 domain-containing protein [Steroidobacteraceae bacterium]|nr:DUF4386 domain-containing protein [Steroidobacteraceae bacterium]
MDEDALHRSPQSAARIAGALYLVIVFVGVFGQALVRDRLVVSGDAAATAQNILASATMWRASVSAELAYLALAVVVDVLLYRLLRPVNPTIALLAFALNLVSIATEVVGRFMLLAPLVLLSDAPYLQPIAAEARQALAYAFLRLHDHGFALALIFFGAVCLAWGYLIRTSGFLPPVLGWLMQLAGACYLVNSFALLLAPPLAGALFPAILLPAFVAELGLALWLVARGVDAGAWRSVARSSRTAEALA